MPWDLPGLRTALFRDYGTSPTSFSKRLLDHKDNDFYFKLDEIEPCNELSRRLDLYYLLAQLDERSITERALTSSFITMDAWKIPALYACESCALAESRCYRAASEDPADVIECSRCFREGIPCWFTHGSTRLLCRDRAEVEKELRVKPLTLKGWTGDSWAFLLFALSEGERYHSDRQWKEDILSLVTLGVGEDGRYRIRLRDFEARQADDTTIGRCMASEGRQAERAQGRQDLGAVVRDRGKGKQREDMDAVADNAICPGITLTTPGQTITNLQVPHRQSKRSRDEPEPSFSKRYKAVDTRAVSNNFSRLSMSDRVGGPIPQDAVDTATSSSRQLPLSEANKHAIEYHRAVLSAGLGTRFEEERGPAFRTWLDKTMDGYENLITTDWEGVENMSEVMMQGWTAFFMQALLSQPRST